MASLPNDSYRQAAEQLLSGSHNLGRSLPAHHPQFPTSQSQNFQASQLPTPQGYNVYPQLPNLDLSHSQSLNTIPSVRQEYVLSEDLFAGHRYNGAMSNVRRFFCLFVTFDFLFTCLMWIICITLAGENLIPAIKKEIIHYDIHTSLFDIVMAALCRFTALLLFYSLLYINHWIIIALSTAGTCAFLIAKVFMFNWPSSSQPVFEVLLVLTSFVLAWSEAWFFDFRVIPQEILARQFFVGSQDCDRAPLVRSYVDGLQSVVTESVGNFYSPLESPQGSQYGDTDSRRLPGDHLDSICEELTINAHRYTQQEEEDLKREAKDCCDKAVHLLNSPEWKLVKENPNGDKVHSMQIPNKGKIFKLTAIVNTQPSFVMDEMFKNVENIPNWNPTIIEVKKIQSIDERTDFLYFVTAASGGGLVSPRDFVDLRHCDIRSGVYINAIKSITHPSVPPQKKYIRAENGVGCVAMQPIPGEPNKSIFQMVINSNLKGWIPKYVLELAYTEVMFNYLHSLRKYSAELGQKHRGSSATAMDGVSHS